MVECSETEVEFQNCTWVPPLIKAHVNMKVDFDDQKGIDKSIS